MTEPSGGEFSKRASEAEQIASGKIRDILKGDLLIQFTRPNRVGGILTKGMMSMDYAKAHGEEITPEYPGKSLPECVYFYREFDDPNSNENLLIIQGNPNFLREHRTNAAIIFHGEGIVPVPAIPSFPGSFPPQELQCMVRGNVPKENNVGVAIIAGPRNDYGNVQKEVKEIIEAVKSASASNPDLAVPVYDQVGNVLWPIQMSREDIIRT